MRLGLFLRGVVAAGLLAACGSSVDATTTTSARFEPVGSIASALSVSASKATVPRDLLVAIAKVEDGLSIPAERLQIDIDIDNEVPAAGPLQLRRGRLDTLARGAELVGKREIDLRMHADLALEAGARVLAEIGARTGARTSDLASWSEAVAEMSGFADEAHREHYVHQVYATLARGGRFTARDGEIVELDGHDELPPSLTIDLSDKSKIHPLATSEYPGAEWIPTSCTNKCTPGRGGAKVELIVIHDTEGNWNASVATLQNDPDKSVQYIVGTDGRVAQFVTEDTTAWHAGNFNFNQRSVGIEHVGYAKQPFTEEEYAASAKLVDYLAKKFNVPRDRSHIIGHDQVPNGSKIAATSAPCSTSPKECEANTSYGGSNHHTDPGIWEWATFMARFEGSAKCNDVPDLLTCSNDKLKAFRCVSDKVELLTCSSPCTPGDATTAATCVVAPASAPPPPPAAKEETPSGFLPPASNVPVREDSGCAVSRRSRTTTTNVGVVGAFVALAALAALRFRRRRSARY